MERKKHHTHLSLEERRQIYLMLGRKMSAVEIAKKLGRHHSTIYREINRNMYFEEDDHKMNGYYPLNAQEYYRRRRQSLQLFRRYPELKAFIIEKNQRILVSRSNCWIFKGFGYSDVLCLLRNYISLYL